jgi:CRISPR type IV-associated protein Csf1
MKATYFLKYKSGKYQCAFCGIDCDDEFNKSNYIGDTFTNHNELIAPGSDYVCSGCVESLKEKNTLNCNWEIRISQRMRAYSWILTKENQIAYTKAHISILRDTCLNPPEPPFSICISDSGKKHYLFRTPVAFSRDNFPVMFEEIIYIVNTKRLSEIINFLKPIIAASSKKYINESTNYSLLSSLSQMFSLDECVNILNQLKIIQRDSLYKLALWLSPNKEDCKNEFENNNTAGVQTENSLFGN